MIEAPLTAEEVAAQLKMGKSWVYTNKLLLGGFKMCPGRKGWRFKAEVVELYLRSRQSMVEDDEEVPAGPYKRIDFPIKKAG